jgi:hypothetical protein
MPHVVFPLSLLFFVSFSHLFPKPNAEIVQVPTVAIHPKGPGTFEMRVPMVLKPKNESLTALKIEVNCQIKKMPVPIAKAKPMITVNLKALFTKPSSSVAEAIT